MSISFDRCHFETNSFTVPDPPRIHKVIRFVKKYYYLQGIKNLRVLECGIAHGGLADILSNEGVQSYGIDINPRWIPNVNCIQGDLNLGLPMCDDYFDIVFAGELIEHLYDDIMFVKECYRILRADGLFIITVPNLVFSINRLRMLVGLHPLFSYKPYHYHIYTKKIIKNIVELAGFKVLKIESSHILFSSRKYKVGRIFEILGNFMQSIGAHLIIYSQKVQDKV